MLRGRAFLHSDTRSKAWRVGQAVQPGFPSFVSQLYFVQTTLSRLWIDPFLRSFRSRSLGRGDRIPSPRPPFFLCRLVSNPLSNLEIENRSGNPSRVARSVFIVFRKDYADRPCRELVSTGNSVNEVVSGFFPKLMRPQRSQRPQREKIRWWATLTSRAKNCHCERSEAISPISRLLRRKAPRNDSFPLVGLRCI